MENIKSVLFVIDTIKRGGAQKVLSTLAHVLKKNGIQVKICVLKKTDNDIELNGLDITYCVSENQRLSTEFFSIMTQLSRDAKKYDLLIGFMDFAANFLTSLAATLNNKPYILSVRCEISQAANLLEFPEVTKELVSLSYSNAQLIISNSKSSQNDLVTHYGVETSKISILKNPLDLKYITSASQESLNKDEEVLFQQKTIVAVGRLSFQKNYKSLFQAIKIVIEKYALNVKLIVLGEGEEKNELENFIKENKLENNIYLMGNRNNVYKYLSRADIFVHTAYFEGSPNTVLEAMAVGVPIAASRIPPIQELITEGKNGLLFDHTDPYDIAFAILKLLQENSLSVALSNNARKSAKQHDIAIFEQNVLSLFKKMCRKKFA